MNAVVPVDDPLLVALGRLRHSWLENQLLLVLNPGFTGELMRSDAMRLADQWCVEATRLLDCCNSLPGVIDPSRFLKAYLRARGLDATADESEKLEKAFTCAFEREHGRTPDNARYELLAAASELRAALDSFQHAVRRSDPERPTRITASQSATHAYSSAKAVHHLLARIPRGVYLP